MKLNDIQIIYENDDLLVINKPAGLLTHSDDRSKEENLCDWILEKYPQLEEVGESLILSDGREIKRPGIVHRLDKETSGVLIIAKNQDSFLHLKEQFKEREIKKVYNAFVWGRLKNEEGVIDRPIGRSKKDFRLWSAQRGAGGKIREAVTEYKVLKQNDEFSFLEVNLKTGRTHQIRVHMKAINYPVVGDRLYAPKRDYALGFNRLALHAQSIEFSLQNGKKIKIEIPFPDDFENALNIIK